MSNLVINDYKQFFPETWKSCESYENALYILDELDKGSEEYAKTSSLFDTRKPVTIHRVQHPIAYMRYLVHTEFLQKESLYFTENLTYFPVSEQDVDVCLNYNCDSRVISGNPSFHPSPQYLDSDYVIVLKNRSCEIETDKNYYPMYAAKFVV